jgi:hypothetical protein
MALVSMDDVNNNYCVQNEVQEVNIDISLILSPPVHPPTLKFNLVPRVSHKIISTSSALF